MGLFILQRVLLCWALFLMCRGNICCPKLEGFMDLTVSDGTYSLKLGVNISYDPIQQKLREVYESTTMLYFFKEGIGYDIENGTCSRGTVDESFSQLFRIPDNARLLKKYRLGPNLIVSDYDFVFKATGVVMNITRTVTANCMPIVEVESQKIGQYIRTTLIKYEDVALEIKDPSVFDVPSVCKKSKQMKRMKEWNNKQRQPFFGRIIQPN